MATQQYTYYQPTPTDPGEQPELLETSAPPEQPQHTRLKKWLKALLLVLVVIVLIAMSAVGWTSWKFFKETTRIFPGTPLGNARAFFTPAHLSTDANGRTNILLIGNSSDDPGHEGSDLTDSIMIISLNAQSHSAALISVPRDLLVNIPDYGYQKINSAYHWGNDEQFSESNYPSGGVGLLEQILTKNLAIDIHYYALVNYAALRNIVNAVGGIDVTIQSSDKRGLYDPNISDAEGGPLKLRNGVQHLDGQTALNLARARGDPTNDGRVGYGFPRSDFDRTEHQRQIFAALQSKIVSAGTLSNPFKIGHIIDAIGSNITTDLQLNEARAVVSILRSVQGNAMQSVALTSDQNPLLKNYTYRGQDTLIPSAGLNNYTAIQKYLTENIQ